MPTIVEETKLRNHLRATLEDLPNNLPHYDESWLLGTSSQHASPPTPLTMIDDLTLLLRSPLFLYAISPRLITPSSPSTYEPPTPMSMTEDKTADAFNISNLEIRIKWLDDSWAAQLSYGDNVLLEGRELDAEQELGFVQSFFWFCEEASFLAYEYKAREHAGRVRLGEAVDVEPFKDTVIDDMRWTRAERSRGRDKRERRSLKLKIRLRSTARGSAGVWRVE